MCLAWFKLSLECALSNFSIPLFENIDVWPIGGKSSVQKIITQIYHLYSRTGSTFRDLLLANKIMQWRLITSYKSNSVKDFFLMLLFQQLPDPHNHPTNSTGQN